MSLSCVCVKICKCPINSGYLNLQSGQPLGLNKKVKNFELKKIS